MSPARRTAGRSSISPRTASARRAEEQFVRPEEPWRYVDTEDAREFIGEIIDSRPWGNGYDETLSYFPGDRVLPAEGAWVSVLRPPHTTIDTQFGDTYFAVPFHDGVYGWRDFRYSISVTTPDGDVRLFPHEYAVLPVAEIVRAWADGEYAFTLMADVDAAEFADKLFYVQTRGIPLEVAFPMVLGTGINAPVGWFRLAGEAAEIAAEPPASKRRTRKRKEPMEVALVVDAEQFDTLVGGAL